jgi:iron only hydrogenase large subunit-like protein
MSVFLADVDDYLSPGAACVNPLFAGGPAGAPLGARGEGEAAGKRAPAARKRTKAAAAARSRRRGANPTPRQEPASSNDEGIHYLASDTPANATSEASLSQTIRLSLELEREDEGDGPSQATQARRADPSPSLASAEPWPGQPDAVKLSADIADCLACSGCVTTAETVLLREHSTDKFRRLLVSGEASGAVAGEGPPLVLTLSPASAAELLRRLSSAPEEQEEEEDPERGRSRQQLDCRRLASLLCRQLKATAVVDGALPLQWSLQQAAVEFCDRYQKNNAGTVLSSSCPAAVCLAEKAHHDAIPSLSLVMSPLACAGTYLAGGEDDGDRHKLLQPSRLRHVAIMPCHDKKLEATRADVAAVVDIVLTTSEAWQLLVESVTEGRHDDHDHVVDHESPPELRLRALLRHLEPAIVDAVASGPGSEFRPRHGSLLQNSWITCAKEEAGPSSELPPSPAITYTSGGYADYIFRYAAQHLFGAGVGGLVWRAADAADSAAAADGAATFGSSRGAATVKQRRTTSARVAAARREVLEATLYRHEYRCIASRESDSVAEAQPVVRYSCESQAEAVHLEEVAMVSSTPVLRFAMAHGLQTMERAMVAAGASASAAPATGERNKRYHYIEAMACPSGCLNGGGQIPGALAGATSSSLSRETPTESRARVTSALRHLALPVLGAPPYSTPIASTGDENAAVNDGRNGFSLRAALKNVCSHGPASVCHPHRREEVLQTSFQAVQPLEFRSGATKGMAVKDMQW